MSEECHLHDGRFFDPERRQWGYEVYCSNEAPHECTGERELFRVLDSVVANASARPEGLDFDPEREESRA